MLEKQQIILRHFHQGMSQRTISRELGLSRNTIKKYVDGYMKNRSLQDSSSKGVLDPPRYDSSSRTKPKLTEQVRDRIDQYLSDNERKRSTGLAKQCMRRVDMHEALIADGFEISYTTVCEYVKLHHRKGKEIFIRQHIDPGQNSEFDWAEVKLIIGGKQKRLMLAVFTNGYSNYRWAGLYYRQDMSSFLHAHVQYLTHIGGVPAQIVYDNMRTAVARFAIRNADKRPTDDLLKISTYYQFDIRFCNVYKANEKGRVERSVEYVRRKTFAQNDEFIDLDSANRHLKQKLTAINNRKSKGESRTFAERLSEEKTHMTVLPVSAYDTALIQTLRVDKYHTISVDTNHYSIPENLRGPIVDVRIYPLHIHIYDKNGDVVDIHQRRHCKYRWFIKIEHYLKTLAIKPGALPNSEALFQADAEITALYNQYFSDQPKIFIDVFRHATKHQLSISIITQAVDQCLKTILNSPLTSDKIIFMIQALMNKQNEIQPLTPSPLNEQISFNCVKQLQDIQAIF